MSAFEEWKAARVAFDDTEDAYNAAHNAVIAAGNKRGAAWEALVQAARKLSSEEKAQAALHDFGPAVSPSQSGSEK